MCKSIAIVMVLVSACATSAELGQSEQALSQPWITDVYAKTSAGTGLYRLLPPFDLTTNNKVYAHGGTADTDLDLNVRGLTEYFGGVWRSGHLEPDAPRRQITVAPHNPDDSPTKVHVYTDLGDDLTGLAFFDLTLVNGGGGDTCGDQVCGPSETISTCPIDCCLSDLQCF
jgi:hypothetical protein